MAFSILTLNSHANSDVCSLPSHRLEYWPSELPGIMHGFNQANIDHPQRGQLTSLENMHAGAQTNNQYHSVLPLIDSSGFVAGEQVERQPPTSYAAQAASNAAQASIDVDESAQDDDRGAKSHPHQKISLDQISSHLSLPHMKQAMATETAQNQTG